MARLDWISIAVSGCAGGLGAAVASLIVRHPKRRPISFLALSLALIAVLHAAGRHYILDPLHERRIEADLQMAIAGIPVYQVLREHDPVEYERLTGSLRESLISGRSRDETVARARVLMGEVINRYLPHAGDAAAVRYIGVITEELRQLQEHDADLCYRFAYPQDGAAVDLRAYVDEETLVADVDALAEVIRTAATHPRVVPAGQEVEADLMIVYGGLREVYGEEADLLGEPTMADVDRAKICSLLISFYLNVLDLPAGSGGRIIRYLFSDSE